MEFETQNMHILQTLKHNPKVSPFGIALAKKLQIKLENAGTIDRFSLAFQYQILRNTKWTKTIAFKILYK